MKILHLVLVGALLLAPIAVAAGPGGTLAQPGSDPGVESAGGDTVESIDGNPPPERASGPGGAVWQTDGDRSDDAEAEGQLLNVLSIPVRDLERSTLERQHADLGPAVGLGSAETTDRIATGALEAALEEADTGAERETVLREELTAIETATATLGEREREAIGEFTANQRSARELLVTLAEIDRAAATLESRSELVAERTEAADSTAVDADRVAAVQYRLQTLQGPVRDHAAAVLSAEHSSDRILVETGGDSVALAAIDGEQYIRETTRADRRGDAGGDLADETVEEIVVGDFPLLWDRRTSFRHGPETRLSVQLGNGAFETFVDPETESVFRNSQRVPLDAIVASERTVKVQDGIEVTVRRTYAGGPLQLSIADADTGEPLNATVTIGQNGEESETIGRTNEAGELWTMTPREQFTITVLGEANSAAFVDITPQDPEEAVDSSRSTGET
jgi:hypothetical protein